MQIKSMEEERTGQENSRDTYVDVLITKLGKAGINHRISYTNKTFLFNLLHSVAQLELIVRLQCNLTDLSNCLFVYVAGKVIPTIPPKIVVQSVKRCTTKEIGLVTVVTCNSMGKEEKNRKVIVLVASF